MNSLSWFLYFASIVSDIKFLFILFGFLGGIGFSVFCTYQTIEEQNTRYNKWLFVPALSLFLGVLVPNQNTLYAIAASQMGEKALESSIGKKSLMAIEKWIDSQIDGVKK